MSEFKEFQGKSVDDAIEEACSFFQTERDKLEIEILSGGSTGIFGLVGVKKAKIQAKLRNISDELTDIVAEVTEKLVAPITENPIIDVVVEGDKVTVTITDKENSGLIIGREGHTLAAFQYMIARIVARKWPHPLKIRLNTGEYREKQDETLKQIALHLADKAISSGRPQSTRPLSSYHRRLVHMVLQEQQGIITKSKGEGLMKKVLILPKRELQREGFVGRASRGRD